MKKPGRNEPCHCGSGRKYKKCCLRKDEEDRRLALEQQQYERDVARGRIDPFAGDEDWEEEPVEENDDEYLDEEPELPPDYSLPSADESPEPEQEEKKELQPEELAIIEKWGEQYVKLKDPDKLHDHIAGFMDAHPELVGELDLAGEPLLELGGMYVRQGRHAEYIDLLIRFRSEFPGEYVKSFPYFDNTRIYWFLINGQKEKVADYLDNYRKYPDRDADNLFELINFMMSWNCQDIMADFLMDICETVCTSPMIIGGAEIITPIVTILMSPHLDQGLAHFDAQKLADEIRTVKDFVNPDWLDPEFLEKRVGIILGKQTSWNLDDCRTRRQAIERYSEMSEQFMGWLARTTQVDWLCAQYHSGLVYEYLAEALPAKKKHRTEFPFAENLMERHLAKLTGNILWLNPTRLFGMLNGIYCFQGFLEDTHSLTGEEAERNRKACVSLFEKVYPFIVKQDFKALAWKQFPRADMTQC